MFYSMMHMRSYARSKVELQKAAGCEHLRCTCSAHTLQLGQTAQRTAWQASMHLSWTCSSMCQLVTCHIPDCINSTAPMALLLLFRLCRIRYMRQPPGGARRHFAELFCHQHRVRHPQSVNIRIDDV
jgi:hypothetical protein